MNNIVTDLVDCTTSQAAVGERYERLTVKRIGRTNSPRRYYAICECDCGEMDIPVQIARLKSGKTKSCGCFNKAQKTTHGLYYTPLYQRWAYMMSRCFKPNTSNFADYGGRGISVCERWKTPQNFIEDMSPSFSDRLQLDRVDTNGDYSKENCRWVTQLANLDNRRNTVIISHNGKTQSLLKWSEQLGISRKVLAHRICERGWSVERAFATPVLSRAECAVIANAASHAKR